MEPREPTSEECNQNAAIGDGFACWYPQMGGYVAHCVVVPLGECFDAYVWHDGEFPFDGEARDGGYKERPRVLHHCRAEQFVEFGQTVSRLLS